MRSMEHALSTSIRDAQNDGSYPRAFARARAELEGKGLEPALKLVLSTVDEDRVLYDALAARWSARAYEDLGLSLHELHWTTWRFLEYRETHRRDAGDALYRLLRRA